MKKFIAGVLVGLLISSGVAFASNGMEVIQAILNRDIKMTWNGAVFEPIDPANGQRVYPIVYSDRTYIPARFVAEKAGISRDSKKTRSPSTRSFARFSTNVCTLWSLIR